jgi:hypothetical protein
MRLFGAQLISAEQGRGAQMPTARTTCNGSQPTFKGAIMSIAQVNNTHPVPRWRLASRIGPLAACLLFGPLLLAFMPAQVQADQHLAALGQQLEPGAGNTLEGVSRWIGSRFSDSEIAELAPEDFRVEQHACHCSDKPDPHFPYLVVLFTTPRGDLVARAEGQENMARITPLAVRNGEKYCRVDAEDQCYGSFASVCEFTDFRYGPYLAPFFPDCK